VSRSPSTAKEADKDLAVLLCDTSKWAEKGKD